MSEIIYRIQDKSGRGPYKPGFTHTWADKDRDESTRPPFFHEFGFDVVRKALVGQAIGCGFRSIKQLKAWFSANEMDRLYAVGYVIVKIDADAILGESDKQLVFARNKPLNEGAKEVLIIKAV